jgi:hypothetical protein
MSFIANLIPDTKYDLQSLSNKFAIPHQIHCCLLANLLALLYYSHAFRKQIFCRSSGAVFGYRSCSLFYVNNRTSPILLLTLVKDTAKSSFVVIFMVWVCLVL